eukprot:Sspe_Gene.66824::Locus_39485_Transcript_1_1_Confidence_1.000_Length_1479::g.66824::m.66824
MEVHAHLSPSLPAETHASINSAMEHIDDVLAAMGGRAPSPSLRTLRSVRDEDGRAAFDAEAALQRLLDIGNDLAVIYKRYSVWQTRLRDAVAACDSLSEEMWKWGQATEERHGETSWEVSRLHSRLRQCREHLDRMLVADCGRHSPPESKPTPMGTPSWLLKDSGRAHEQTAVPNNRWLPGERRFRSAADSPKREPPARLPTRVPSPGHEWGAQEVPSAFSPPTPLRTPQNPQNSSPALPTPRTSPTQPTPPAALLSTSTLPPAPKAHPPSPIPSTIVTPEKTALYSTLSHFTLRNSRTTATTDATLTPPTAAPSSIPQLPGRPCLDEAELLCHPYPQGQCCLGIPSLAGEAVWVLRQIAPSPLHHPRAILLRDLRGQLTDTIPLRSLSRITVPDLPGGLELEATDLQSHAPPPPTAPPSARRPQLGLLQGHSGPWQVPDLGDGESKWYMRETAKSIARTASSRVGGKTTSAVTYVLQLNPSERDHWVQWLR